MVKKQIRIEKTDRMEREEVIYQGCWMLGYMVWIKMMV